MIDSLIGTTHNVDLAQECLRAAIVFFYGMVMLKLSGRRTFAQWSALDIVISIIVGSSLSRAMTGSAPFGVTLASVAVLVVLHVAVAFAVAHYRWASKLIEGEPVVLAQNGKVDDAMRKRHYISTCDIHEAVRQEGLERLDQTKTITLEPKGKISIIKAAAPKPA